MTNYSCALFCLRGLLQHIRRVSRSVALRLCIAALCVLDRLPQGGVSRSLRWAERSTRVRSTASYPQKSDLMTSPVTVLRLSL